MNRPEKRNALNNELRGAILAALQEADADPDMKVSILRGAGPAFSAGYELSQSKGGTSARPYRPLRLVESRSGIYYAHPVSTSGHSIGFRVVSAGLGQLGVILWVRFWSFPVRA